MDIPTLKEFLALPIDQVRPIVPATMIFAAGGTRRSAALAGVSRDDYPSWALQRMLAICQIFCHYGVKHIILPIGHPRMFAEEGHFGNNFVTWIAKGLSSSQTLEFYRKANWQDHIIVIASNATKNRQTQQLQTLAQSRNQTTSQADAHLWYFIVPDYDDYWLWTLERLATVEKTTRECAIQSLYGADIPPTDLLISFGKPTISLDILPPLLWNVVQAYWTQVPSYILDEDTLRKIFYDYAYQRNTYQTDKTGRERDVLKHPSLWKHGPTIGTGIRVDRYWYPEQILLPTDDLTDE
ncbi:MAG: hypothetical protein JXB07_21800 [Anaerolineae bacterium]|nr:hypothetical protein [Anaerolineae bacterium]